MIRFSTIAGVALAYDRRNQAEYGTRGQVLRDTGPVTPEFYAALNAWMETLGELCPWGKPELLVVGGVTGGRKPVPGKVDRHAEGKAIDVDAMYWPAADPDATLHPFVTKLDWKRRPALYLAVEATLRLHFGTVLDAWYDQAHVDHFHIDSGHPVGWHSTRSHLVFLQTALNELWCPLPKGVVLDVDGVAGPRTLGAARDVLRGLLADSLEAGWTTLLRSTARRGFEAAV